MQSAEFDKWLKSHVAAFGGLKQWLRENPDCMTAWRECLSDVTLADALRATQLLNAGDEEAPRGFGDHARAVRRVAYHIANDRKPESSGPRFVGGEQVFDCPTCQDSGVVLVANIWRAGHKRPLQKFWSGQTQYLPTCAVACDCDARRPRSLVQINRDRMFVIDEATPIAERADQFREWWNQGHRYGREQVFDQFNEGAF